MQGNETRKIFSGRRKTTGARIHEERKVK